MGAPVASCARKKPATNVRIMFMPLSTSRPVAALRAAGLYIGKAPQLTMDAGDTLDLAFGRKTLVKAFVTEGPDLLGPGGEAFAPALHATFLRLGLTGRQINAHPNHRFEG